MANLSYFWFSHVNKIKKNNLHAYPHKFDEWWTEHMSCPVICTTAITFMGFNWFCRSCTGPVQKPYRYETHWRVPCGNHMKPLQALYTPTHQKIIWQKYKCSLVKLCGARSLMWPREQHLCKIPTNSFINLAGKKSYMQPKSCGAHGWMRLRL